MDDNNELRPLTPVPNEHSSFNPELLIDGLQRLVFISLASWYFLQTRDVLSCIVLVSAGFLNHNLAHMIMKRFLKSWEPDDGE